jgi:hypothetical protein
MIISMNAMVTAIAIREVVATHGAGNVRPGLLSVGVVALEGA